MPLGMGISAISALFYGRRSALILASGTLIIAFGVLQLLGHGFTVGPLARLRTRIRDDTAVFSLGAVYGFAGFCSGPILAAASGEALRGAALLAVYAVGMVVPLFLMSLLWDRLELGSRRFFRGREISLGRLRLHTTNLLSGAMFILLGTLFIAYEGTSALYESNGATNLAFAAQQWANGVARRVPGTALLFRGWLRRGYTAKRGEDT